MHSALELSRTNIHEEGNSLTIGTVFPRINLRNNLPPESLDDVDKSGRDHHTDEGNENVTIEDQIWF